MDFKAKRSFVKYFSNDVFKIVVTHIITKTIATLVIATLCNTIYVQVVIFIKNSITLMGIPML